MDIASWIFFGFKYIWLALGLTWSIILKNPTNIEEFGHLEYKITLIIKFENLNIYFKIKNVAGILGWIFYSVWYWYTSITSRIIKNFKVFGWNSIQKTCFFAFV